MLMQEPTEEMIKEWKDIFNIYKDKLVANKKDSLDIIKYIEEKHSIVEIEDQKLENIVYDNIVLNDYYKNKLNGRNPIIRLFEVTDKKLYDVQDNVFKGNQIIVGIELNTAYIFVEGSSLLHDELVAFTGLDEEDIKNYFLVAQYIKCKEKFKN